MIAHMARATSKTKVSSLYRNFEEISGNLSNEVVSSALRQILSSKISSLISATCDIF